MRKYYFNLEVKMTFDSLFDLIQFDPTYFRYHRPFREVDGYRVIEKDGKMFILVNALGVDEKDISVETISEYGGREAIVVSGSTKNEIFENESSINIKFLMRKHMEEVHWNLSNGFLTLEVSFKEPVKPSVKVIKD